MHSITIKYEKPMVTIPLEEYESLKETIEILSDPKLMRDIRKSQKEYAEGKSIDWEDLKNELDASTGLNSRRNRIKKTGATAKTLPKVKTSPQQAR